MTEPRFTRKQRRGVVFPVAVLAVAVLLPIAVLVGTAFAMGWRFQPIETASMAPSYPAGSLAIIEPVDPAEVRPGMTVVFEDPLVRGRAVAHRVVKRLPGPSPAFATRGDANAENDPAPIHAATIQGKVRWAIPEVGRVVSALSRGWAVGFLVGLPLAILIVTEIAGIWRRRNARQTPLQTGGGASP